MLVFRLVGVLALIGICASIALFLITRDRRYLTLAFRGVQFALILVIAILVFYLLERLMLVI